MSDHMQGPRAQLSWSDELSTPLADLMKAAESMRGGFGKMEVAMGSIAGGIKASAGTHSMPGVADIGRPLIRPETIEQIVQNMGKLQSPAVTGTKSDGTPYVYMKPKGRVKPKGKSQAAREVFGDDHGGSVED